MTRSTPSAPCRTCTGADSVDWAEMEETYRQRLARVLHENLIPGFEGSSFGQPYPDARQL